MAIEFRFCHQFVEDEMELYQNALKVNEIQNRWFERYKHLNYGAIITFAGVVRDECGISGLSFDIHKPLLQSWFDKWQDKAKKQNAIVLMAHSIGDVFLHEASYMAGVCSPQRKVGLKLINEFVEDFKANAPIWKYDLKENERIWAKDRSQMLENAGILKG